MEKNIFFSLVLYGDTYIKKFFSITIKTIIKDLNNLKKNYNIKFLISTKKSNRQIIQKKLDKIIKGKIDFFDISNSHRKYKIVTDQQLKHINQIIKLNKNKNNYLIFLYADMLFSKNAISKCINILINKKKKAVCSFGLLLNQKNKLFEKFLETLIKERKKHLRLLIKNEDLIHNYHKQFNYNNINLSKSFLYEIINNSIYIKSFHYHPIIIKFNNKKNFNFKNVKTLDNYFLEDNFKNNEVYIENDLNKISIYSFDKYRSELIHKFHINNNNNKDIFQRLLLISSYLNASRLEKKLFTKNTLTSDKRILVNTLFKKKKFNELSNESTNFDKLKNILNENKILRTEIKNKKITFFYNNFLFLIFFITTLIKNLSLGYLRDSKLKYHLVELILKKIYNPTKVHDHYLFIYNYISVMLFKIRIKNFYKSILSSIIQKNE